MGGSSVPELINDRYQVGEVIGRGGMATVHVGRDVRLGRQVAIKILRPELAADETFHERFQREAHAVASLNTPSWPSTTPARSGRRARTACCGRTS